MKTTLKILLLLCAFSLIYVWDYNQRFQIEIPNFYSTEESKFFFQYKTIEESQDSITSNWSKQEYQFPRTEIARIEYCKNLPIISQLLISKVSDSHSIELIEIINNPENFDWTETTWNRKESNYYFKFYDQKGNEVSRFWVMDEEVGMSEIRPWVPSTKYGSLSRKGVTEMSELVKRI